MKFSEIVKRIWPHTLANLAYATARLMVGMKKPQANKFFCISLLGESYGDNIKPLSDYLAKHEPEAQIVWAFSKHFSEAHKCPHRVVRLYTVAYYYQMLTSKYILSNARLNQRMIHKRKGQIYLQTWHGTALKRLGTDIKRKRSQWEQLYNPGVFEFDVNNTDVMISGSRFMTNLYRDKFLFKGKIAETGTPRNDIFFSSQPKLRQKICDTYGLEEGKLLILYAPTFRADRKYTYYSIDLKQVKDTWERKTGRACDVLVRLHPKLRQDNKAFEKAFGKGVTDVTSYPDMQELLYVCDLFITDYSATMFDFIYTCRPLLIFAPDHESYNRGFYFQLSELPFMVITDNQDIEKTLTHFNPQTYGQRVDAFLERIGSVERGNATEQVVNLLRRTNN